jgi:enamine deaminase RidA (YjgF/YER057c/UK114 family)
MPANTSPALMASNTPDVPAPHARWYSHAVAIDLAETTLLHLAGQMALDEDGSVSGGMREQAERVFDLLLRTLEHHACSFDDVVCIRTYITDLAQVSDYAAVRARYITGTPPASTTVEVARLVNPSALVEVEIVAMAGKAA